MRVQYLGHQIRNAVGSGEAFDLNGLLGIAI
jgi:hypothetical protein